MTRTIPSVPGWDVPGISPATTSDEIAVLSTCHYTKGDHMQTRTFQITVATNGLGPVTVNDHLYGLEYILVDREDLARLGEKWTVPGYYLLLGDAGLTELPYIGRSHDLRSRVLDQARDRDHFTRVLFVRRTTAGGFTTGDIGRLELHAAMMVAYSLRGGPRNINTPDGATVYPYEEEHAIAYLESLAAVMTVLGYRIEVENQRRIECLQEESLARPHGALTELLAEGYLADGMKTVAWDANGNEYFGRVCADGTLWAAGQPWPDPNGAAAALPLDEDFDGWQLWHVLTGSGYRSFAELQARIVDSK